MRALLVVLAVVGHASAAPLTLADAVRLARSRHPTVEAQRGQVIVAHGRSQQALAGLLPFFTGGFAYQPQTANLVATPPLAHDLLSATGSDTVVDRSGMATVVTCRTPGQNNCMPIPPAPTSWTLQNFWTAQVGLSWTLWDWGRSIYGYQGARTQAAAAEVGIRTAQRDVTLDVKVAFFGAIASDEQLAVAGDAERTYRAHVEQARAFHDAGLRTGIDVATAESALASTTIMLARALAAVDVARAQLAAAMGQDRGGDWTLVAPSDIFEIAPSDERSASVTLEVLVGQAWQRRTELEQLRLGERANLASVRAARGQYLPQLSLDVGPSFGGPDLGSLTGNLTVALALSYPAAGMSPLAVHGQVREAEGNLVVTRAQERAARDNIRREAVDARALLGSARAEMLAARTLVDAAARQRALAEGRYQTGVGNVIELYDALLTDVSARFQMVQARLDLATARARLQHALGEDD
jgi:outer membrane protein